VTKTLGKDKTGKDIVSCVVEECKAGVGKWGITETEREVLVALNTCAPCKVARLREAVSQQQNQRGYLTLNSDEKRDIRTLVDNTIKTMMNKKLLKKVSKGLSITEKGLVHVLGSIKDT
jgi:hypothetical protein